MANDSLVEAKKKESTAEKDDKAEKAGKEVTKDIEYDDKKDKKKKSLKDWFEQIDNNIINEAEQLTIEPAKQSTQVIKKGNDVIGSVSNPALAATIKSAIGKGEMSLAGDDLKEEQPMMEKAPPGMEDVVLSLKKKYPGEEGRAYAIAWSMYNKKHGKNEAAEDNPDSAMLDEKWAGDVKVKPTGQYKDGTVVRVPHKGKMVPGKIVRYDPGKGGESPAYVVDIGEYESKIVPVHDIKQHAAEGAALKEVDQPTIDNMSAKGAGLGRGRNPDVLETKQVNEAMNTLEAAYHEGKAHGLSKHGYTCRYDEGTEEHKRYHDGFKEGLDECYGLMPNRGLVVSEVDSVPATVPGMANQADPIKEENTVTSEVIITPNGNKYKYVHRESDDKAVLVYPGGKIDLYYDYNARGFDMSESHASDPEVTKLVRSLGFIRKGDEDEAFNDLIDKVMALKSGLDEMDKTAYMKQQAMKTPGDTFKAFGQTFKDKEVLETDAFAFESLDKQLNDLLNEGLSVNMSQGLGGPGGQMEDTVSVTAQGDDAGKLLAFIKQVGLGGLGADKPEMIPGEPVVAVSSDYGAPKFGGYDSEPKSMMDLMKVMSGGDDYKDEEHGHDNADEGTCNECGNTMEADHSCGKSKEMVDEVQTPDQLEADSVSEDDGEGYEQGQEAAAQIDSALAASGASKGGATNEDGMESSPLAAGAVAAADADEEQEAAMSESSFLNLYKKLSWLAEESTKKEDEKAEKAGKKVAKDIEDDEGHKGKDDDKAEKAGKKVTKDIEYDDKKDKKEKKLDEWANDAGKDGTDASFERDIEFMTKVIAGGLNKPKSTGQQTIPVLAGDKERTGSEDMAEYKRLAGLGQ